VSKGIQTLTVPGKDAVAKLEQLRQNYQHTGLYPVILGDDKGIGFDTINLSALHNKQQTISESLKINVNEWFRTALSDFEEDAEIGELLEGEWPDEVIPASGLNIPNDPFTQQSKPEIVIGLLEIQKPWETFAALNWGGWNACPNPSEHCAIHKYWYEKYGAEVAGITNDVVECIVTKPPLSRVESLELAKEHYLYCADIVDQGVGEILTLAATLMTSRYWYFWWD
jgi:hypothetical protein